MKNLLGVIVLGIFLYVVMGGTLPSFTHYLDDDVISYDHQDVASDDVFVWLHVVQDENGRHSIQGVSHWGELLTNEFWAGVFQRDPAVQRSYVAQADAEVLVASLPCDVSFVDIAMDDAGQAVDLLGDLCIVGGMGDAKFYPQNHIRRGSVAKMVAGAMMYAYQGSAMIETDGAVVYTDVYGPLVPYLVQLDQRGLLDEIARNEEVFGVNDVLTREEITSFLEAALASLPDTIMVNTTIPLPLESDYVERQMFASMLVSALRMDTYVSSSVLAMQ